MTQSTGKLIDVFFEDGNQIDLDSLSNERRSEINFLIDSAISNESQPIVLPRVTADGLVWYVVPKSSSQCRLLREHLRAFIAPPISDFVGLISSLDSNDDIDRFIEAEFDSNVFKVRTIGEDRHGKQKQRDRLRESLIHFVRMLNEKPFRSLNLARPMGVVYADFEWALSIGDAPRARLLLGELQHFGLLSEENRVYLSFRCDAAEGDFGAILRNPSASDVAQMRRPRLITELLLEAVYFEIIEPNSQHDREEVIKILSNPKIAAFASLSVDGEASTKWWVLLADVLLGYATGVERSHSLRRLHTLYGHIEVVSQFCPIQQHVPKVVQTDQISDKSSVVGLINEFRFAEALRVLAATSVDAEVMRLMAICAREVGTPDAIDQFAQCLRSNEESALSLVTDGKISEELANWISGIQVVDAPLPKSGVEWLTLVRDGHERSVLMHYLEEYGDDWELNIPDQSQILLAAELIEEMLLDEERMSIVRNGLPFLHRQFAIYGVPERAALLAATLNSIALSIDLSETDRTVLLSIADDLFELPRDSVYRKDVFRELQSVWNRIQGSRNISWALDAIFLVRSVATVEDLEAWNLMTSLISGITSLPEASIDRAHETAVRIAADLVGIGDDAVDRLFPIVQDTGTKIPEMAELIEGKKIGLYCLDERASRRIRERLLDIQPNCEVVLRHDLQCTPELASLAENADLMVILTASAKHAASACIASHLNGTRQIRVHSIGVASVLTGIEKELTDLIVS